MSMTPDDFDTPSNSDPYDLTFEAPVEFALPEDPATDPAAVQASLVTVYGEHHRMLEDTATVTLVEPPPVEPGQDLRVDPPKEVLQEGGTQP